MLKKQDMKIDCNIYRGKKKLEYSLMAATGVRTLIELYQTKLTMFLPH